MIYISSNCVVWFVLHHVILYHFATHNYQVVSCSGPSWWRGLLEQSRNDGEFLEMEYFEYLFRVYICQPCPSTLSKLNTSHIQNVDNCLKYLLHIPIVCVLVRWLHDLCF